MSQFLNKTSTAVMMLIIVIGLVVYFGRKSNGKSLTPVVAKTTDETKKVEAAV